MSFLQRSVAGHSFLVHLPRAEGPLPAILFLHGRGESGTGGEQAREGLPRALAQAPERWPFLVVMPQKPDFDSLWPDWTAMLAAILSAVESEFTVDPARRYLTGLSQGGHGTLALAHALPWRFAAIAPVCGWADPMRAARDLQRMPAWLFHGEDDEVVPASCSKAVVDCMARPSRATVPAPRLTLYPGTGHNSWDAAYAEPDLPGWFLSHRLIPA